MTMPAISIHSGRLSYSGQPSDLAAVDAGPGPQGDDRTVVIGVFVLVRGFGGVLVEEETTAIQAHRSAVPPPRPPAGRRAAGRWPPARSQAPRGSDRRLRRYGCPWLDPWHRAGPIRSDGRGQGRA